MDDEAFCASCIFGLLIGFIILFLILYASQRAETTIIFTQSISIVEILPPKIIIRNLFHFILLSVPILCLVLLMIVTLYLWDVYARK